jgi:hypothetical protein
MAVAASSPVNDWEWRFPGECLRRNPSPAIGDSLINHQNAAGEAKNKVVVQPRFQRDAARCIRQVKRCPCEFHPR